MALRNKHTLALGAFIFGIFEAIAGFFLFDVRHPKGAGGEGIKKEGERQEKGRGWTTRLAIY